MCTTPILTRPDKWNELPVDVRWNRPQSSPRCAAYVVYTCSTYLSSTAPKIVPHCGRGLNVLCLDPVKLKACSLLLRIASLMHRR